jgi:hypothetical protein
MTPETKQAPNGYFRRPRMSSGGTPQTVVVAPSALPDTQSPVRAAGAPVRSGESVRWVEPVGAAPPPTTVPAPTVAAKHAREDGSIVGTIPYLAVLVCTIAGVYVAWHQGSAGGGRGGVVGGIALLVAAVVRLVVPARLAGLLGTRNRVIDVLTLAVFGGGLLIAGLVLPS